MSFFNVIFRPLRGSAVVVALLGLAGGAAQAQASDNNSIVVVVRRSADATQLSVDQVSRIFLGQNDTLPNGAFVTPVDAPESSALYQDFYTKVIGKTAAQIKAYRARQSFTGTGIAPQQAATWTLAFNLNTKASSVITYIRKRDLDDQHHVVLDTGK